MTNQSGWHFYQVTIFNPERELKFTDLFYYRLEGKTWYKGWHYNNHGLAGAFGKGGTIGRSRAIDIARRINQENIFKDDLLDALQKSVKSLVYKKSKRPRHVSPMVYDHPTQNVESAADIVKHLKAILSHLPKIHKIKREPWVTGSEFSGSVFKALGIPCRVSGFNRKEIKAVESFFYGYEFLIRCKKVGLFKNPLAWEEIVGQLHLFDTGSN